MRRRSILIALAALLVAANAAFFLFKTSDGDAEPAIDNFEADVEEVAANWVAYMPYFESSQRSDPQTFGVHSEQPPSDPFDVVDGQPVSRLSMIAGQCAIEQYSIRTSNDNDHYMPERLFAQRLTEDQQVCLLENLPAGYRLSQLTSPTKPSQVSWSTDLSSVTANESANAQTH